MKRLLLIAIIAILVVGGSTFAYTYTTATASIGVTAVESDFATVTANTTNAPKVFGSFTSTWPQSTLFNIEPHEEYSGDLVIKVYLVNAGALLRHYHHSNMSLEFQGSDNATADEQRIFQLLSLDNAEVEFLWENGSGNPPYKVVLTGGSYRLHQWKSLTGGNVQPQLWCEVTQR
jgi:hypothetical protein